MTLRQTLGVALIVLPAPLLGVLGAGDANSWSWWWVLPCPVLWGIGGWLLGRWWALAVAAASAFVWGVIAAATWEWEGYNDSDVSSWVVLAVVIAGVSAVPVTVGVLAARK